MNKKNQTCTDVRPAVYPGQIQGSGPVGSKAVHAHGGPAWSCPTSPATSRTPHGACPTRDGAQEDAALNALVDVVIALGLQRGASGQDRVKRLETVGFH